MFLRVAIVAVDCGQELMIQVPYSQKKNKLEALLGTKEGELSLAHVASSKLVSTLDDPAIELYLIK